MIIFRNPEKALSLFVWFLKIYLFSSKVLFIYLNPKTNTKLEKLKRSKRSLALSVRTLMLLDLAFKTMSSFRLT